MSAADDRLAELLGRWMASVELHARYLSLDDAAYARVQRWPRHERPTRWVVELARQRLVELEKLLAERRARGDPGFAEALELMGFLTTLLGTEHVERFIPLAHPRGPAAQTQPEPARRPATPVDPTVRRPALQSGKAGPASRRPEPRAAAEPRAARAPQAATARRKSAAPARATHAQAPVAAPPAGTEAMVIADAARLISWGREWPQLAGLIARLADR
ncbi:MAG: hypothetical protein ACM3H9_11280, partial [Rhodospirillaceae bacterium]